MYTASSAIEKNTGASDGFSSFNCGNSSFTRGANSLDNTLLMLLYIIAVNKNDVANDNRYNCGPSINGIYSANIEYTGNTNIHINDSMNNSDTLKNNFWCHVWLLLISFHRLAILDLTYLNTYSLLRLRTSTTMSSR